MKCCATRQICNFAYSNHKVNVSVKHLISAISKFRVFFFFFSETDISTYLNFGGHETPH